MARSVSLKELHEWLNKPEIKKYTWCLGKGGAFSSCARGEGGSPVMKYLDICMDLRTYDIWKITARSFIPDTTVVDTTEEDGKTILDLLEEEIHKYINKE